MQIFCKDFHIVFVFKKCFLFYCAGYGNIAPKTPWGKVVTILYAIVGIPLLLLCLSNIGDAMAHSFKFIYWKVCCYMCVRPKKRRKRTIKRHLPIPYTQPVVRQQTNCNNIHPPQPPPPPPPPIPGSPITESPHLHSTSTYHTAPCSSPTISSPSSSPCHQNDRLSPKHAQNALSQSATINMSGYYVQDMPLAPVITNKYALQEDLPMGRQLQGKENAVYPPPAVFTVLKPDRCDRYQYGNHQSYRTSDRYVLLVINFKVL